MSHPDDPAIQLLGIDIALLTPAALLSRFDLWIEAGIPRRVYTLRSPVLLEAERRPRLKQVLRDADLNLAGGEEIRIAARLTGQPVPDRLEPEAWIEPLLGRLAARGAKVAYLGGPPGAGSTWLEAAKRRHPGLDGLARDGSFEKWGPENDRVVSAVLKLRPDVVLVGFGSPYQEEYIHAHAQLFRTPLSIGVGPLAERETGIWPRGPLGDGRLARIGAVLGRSVRQTAAHLADPEFLARVVRAHRSGDGL